MNVKRRLMPIGSVMAALAGLVAPSAFAGQPISSVVSTVSSDLAPVVPGGSCYGKVGSLAGADPNLCRRVLVLKQVGTWIYAGGIIDSVIDRSTGGNVLISGYHNLFRFDATTFAVDTTFKPQLYKSAESGTGLEYKDSAVTGLASSGTDLYVAGSFQNVAPFQGGPVSPSMGVAALSLDGTVDPAFNANVGLGGGSSVVNDVDFVNGSLWLGGPFTHVGGTRQVGLAFVTPVGGLTGQQLSLAGQVTTTVGTKVAQVAVNNAGTKAVVIGNFLTVGGADHEEVVVLDIQPDGTATVDPWNDPTNLHASGPAACKASDTWARGVDWSPDNVHFDIAASGGGGFDAFGPQQAGQPNQGALCDAFSRFDSSQVTQTAPDVVNVTGFDSLFTVVDTGAVAYTGGHNKSLNHAVYIGGVKVPATQEFHYGIGAIDVNTGDAGYGQAVTAFNASTATGRGAGWASSLSTGSGVYIGGDATKVGSDTTIERLAYFPARP
jgi:hypothetical protein